MRRTVMLVLVFGASLFMPQSAAGQEKAAASAEAPKHVMILPSAVQWGDAPPGLPAGSKVAVLYGDPDQAGPFTLRVKAPAGYKVPAHWHPISEYVTVISGTLYMGTGDKLDKSKGTALAAGAFASMPANMRHFVWWEGDGEIQVSGTGPFAITYVNPADDPRNAKK